jgi:hypothetical protein
MKSQDPLSVVCQVTNRYTAICNGNNSGSLVDTRQAPLSTKMVQVFSAIYLIHSSTDILVHSEQVGGVIFLLQCQEFFDFLRPVCR